MFKPGNIVKFVKPYMGAESSIPLGSILTVTKVTQSPLRSECMLISFKEYGPKLYHQELEHAERGARKRLTFN